MEKKQGCSGMAGDVCNSPGYSQLFSESEEKLKQMSYRVEAEWWWWIANGQVSRVARPILCRQTMVPTALWWGVLAIAKRWFERGKWSPGRASSAIRCISCPPHCCTSSTCIMQTSSYSCTSVTSPWGSRCTLKALIPVPLKIKSVCSLNPYLVLSAFLPKIS